MQKRLSYFSLLIAVMMIWQATSAPTFKTPPALNKTTLTTFGVSANDGNIAIISPKLQALQLVAADPGNGTMVTTATMTAFSRKEIGNKKTATATIPQPGTFKFVKAYQNSHSCLFIFEETTKMLAMLNYDNKGNNISVYGKLPLTNLTNDTLTIPQIKARIMVGDMCSLFAFTNGNVSTVYRASADRTSFSAVLPPGGATVNTYSEDMNYAVMSNILYRYNLTSSAWSMVRSFNAHTRYVIYNYERRLIVLGTNSTVTNNSTSPKTLSTDVSIYVIHDMTTGIANITYISTSGTVQKSDTGSQFQLLTSPLKTKFSYTYHSSSGQTWIRSFHADYQRNTMSAITFKDNSEYLTYYQTINSNKQLNFGDVFMIARNGSLFDTSNTTNMPMQTSWQFKGAYAVKVRSRDLTNGAGDPSTINKATDSEFTPFLKTFVDWHYQDRLVVLNLYTKDASTLELVSWEFGNMAEVFVEDKTPTYYISYEEPAHDVVHSLDTGFMATYMKSNGGNTNFNVYLHDNSTAQHYKKVSFTQTGATTFLFQNAACLILKLANGTYGVYAFNATTVAYDLLDDISTLATASNVSAPNDPASWAANADCSRIKVEGNLLKRYANGTYAQDYGIFTAIASDLLTMIRNDSVWVWKPAESSLAMQFTPSNDSVIGFVAGTKIEAYGDRFIAYFTNASVATFWVCIANQIGYATQILHYYFQNYTSQPKIWFSPQLTKILVVGQWTNPKNSQTESKINAFFIDFANRRYFNMSTVTDMYIKPANVFVNFGERFGYIRQLANTYSNASIPLSETTILFSEQTTGMAIFYKKIVVDATVAWKRSFVHYNDQSYFLMTESVKTIASNTTKVRRVEIEELNAAQADFNSEKHAEYIGEIVNGKVKICPAGCKDCECNECLSTFTLEANSGKCRLCPPGCLECSAIDSTCTSCITGAFLNSTNGCEPCQGCFACQGNATNCTACPPGSFYINNICEKCPRNCFNCSDNVTCITCRKGFTVTSNNTCRGCSLKCSSCNATNITQCTACAKGLQLNGSECVPCPNNCLSCRDSVCAECIPGYNPNSAGVCVLQCQLPCVTCNDNQPTSCLSCQEGSTLINDDCYINNTCNADESCEYCGQGLRYYRLSSSTGFTCEVCPTINNCVQCDDTNTYECIICQNGYYVDQDGACQSCNSNCTRCKSAQICTGCKPGWTLMEDYDEGSCISCEHPCRTCYGAPDYCTTCQQGFQKKFWKCQNNTYAGFRIVFNSPASVILAQIDQVVEFILNALNLNLTDTDACTIESVEDGSAIVTGSATPNDGTSAEAATAILSSALSGATIGSSTVTSSTVTTEGVEATSEDSNNTGLIIGLAVGLSVLVIVIVTIIVIVVKKKAAKAAATVSSTSLVEADSKIPQHNKEDMLEVEAIQQ